MDLLEQHGAEIKVISVPYAKYVLPYHYSLVPSEAASNLARFDGIRYGHQPQIDGSHNLDKSKSALFNYIESSKTQSYGMNVKRRIMLGNFLMSSGGGYEDFHQNLVNAQKFRRMIIEQYCKVMRQENIDFIISPNSFGEKPPKIGEILADSLDDKSPVYEYKMDYFTAVSNCLGVPALTMPVSEADQS